MVDGSDKPQDKEPTGFACPRCGCRWMKVVDTVRPTSGVVRRYRVCQHCGSRGVLVKIVTEEIIRRTGTKEHRKK